MKSRNESEVLQKAYLEVQQVIINARLTKQTRLREILAARYP